MIDEYQKIKIILEGLVYIFGYVIAEFDRIQKEGRRKSFKIFDVDRII